MSKALVQLLIGCMCAAAVFFLNGEIVTALFLLGIVLLTIRVASL